MAETANIERLIGKPSEAYTARASIANGVIDSSTSIVTGDRTTGLFSSKNEMGKMDFLRLLVMQMQYQDPLSPVDNTEFAAQLAQFSALEGNMNIEKAIGKLNDSFTKTVEAQGYSAQSITNASAVSLIGKEARIVEKQVRVKGITGEKIPIRVHLGNNDGAAVQIRDANGAVIRTLNTTGKDAQNSAVVEWDGLTDEGTFAGSGVYEVYIKGQDTDTSLYAFVEDTVQGVRFTAGGPLVKIAGKELSISDIMDVSTENAKSGFEGLSAASAVGLIGKTVRVADDSISFVNKGEEQTPQIIEMKAYLGLLRAATLEILDSSGKVVYRGRQSADSNGTATFVWDGRDMDTFDFVPTGTYSVRLVEGAYTNDVYTYAEGVVDGVSNLSSGTRIRVNGTLVPLSAILDIASTGA